ADDLNAELKKNAAFPLFRRAVGDNLEPVWPQKWSSERLAARRQEIGSLSFARGYRLVCIPDEEVPIRAGWVQFYLPQMNADEHRLEEREKIASTSQGSQLCSSASICGQYERVILSVDPAVSQRSTADCSALVTLGKTGNNQVHCLEAIARRVSTPDLIELIDDADRRWR